MLGDCCGRKEICSHDMQTKEIYCRQTWTWTRTRISRDVDSELSPHHRLAKRKSSDAAIVSEGFSLQVGPCRALSSSPDKRTNFTPDVLRSAERSLSSAMCRIPGYTIVRLPITTPSIRQSHRSDRTRFCQLFQATREGMRLGLGPAKYDVSQTLLQPTNSHQVSCLTVDTWGPACGTRHAPTKLALEFSGSGPEFT